MSFLIIMCYLTMFQFLAGRFPTLHAFKAQELDVEKELTGLIAKVQKGHLIELQEICGDWGPLDWSNGWGGTCKKSPSDPMASLRRWNFQVNPTGFNSYHTTIGCIESLSHWTCCEHWSWYSLNIIEHLTYRVATLVVYQLYVFRFGWIFVTWRMLWLVTTVTISVSTGTQYYDDIFVDPNSFWKWETVDTTWYKPCPSSIPPKKSIPTTSSPPTSLLLFMLFLDILHSNQCNQVCLSFSMRLWSSPSLWQWETSYAWK